MKKLRLLAYVVLLTPVLMGTTSAFAGVVFEATQTGSELAVNSSVTFPGGSHTVSGGSLDLNPDLDKQLLLQWDLLTPGVRGDLLFDIAIDYVPLSGDNDPRFMISDGTNAFAIVRSDNQGGRLGTSWGSLSGATYLGVGGDLVTTGLGGVDVFQFSFFVSDDGLNQSYLSNYQEGSYAQATNSIFASNALDTDQQLSFFVASGNSPSELYRINSIAIKVTEVPEPLPLVLLISGLAGLVGRWKQKS